MTQNEENGLADMVPNDNFHDTWLVYADFLEESGMDTVELRESLTENDLIIFKWNWESRGVGAGGVGGVGGVGGGIGGVGGG
jgi:hypothetical protein